MKFYINHFLRITHKTCAVNSIGHALAGDQQPGLVGCRELRLSRPG